MKEGPGGLQDVRLIGLAGDAQRGARGRSASRTGRRHSSRPRAASCIIAPGCDHNIVDFEAQESPALPAFARGKTSSDWMREYFQCARTIFNEARRAIEGAEKSQSSLLENFREYRSRLSNQEFTVSRERLLLRNPAQLANDPTVVFRMLEFIGRHGVMPAAETERRLEASREAFAAYCAQARPLWPALKTMLACPHAAMALRTLENHRPDARVCFPSGARSNTWSRRIRGTAIRWASIRCGRSNACSNWPVAATPERRRFAGLLSEIDDATLLLFALLFHEMGTAAMPTPLRLAVKRAREAMARIQMPDDAQSTVEFLIRHQSDLSEAMSGRDMDDPASARLLADRVGTIERLKMLAVMTYARIVGIGEEAKVPWRLEQLWRACSVAQHELMRELETDRIQQVPENFPGNAEFVKGFPLRYLRAHSASRDYLTSATLRAEQADRSGRYGWTRWRGRTGSPWWRGISLSCLRRLPERFRVSGWTF